MSTINRNLATGIHAYAIKGTDGNIANIILAAPDVIGSLGYPEYADVSTVACDIGRPWSATTGS